MIASCPPFCVISTRSTPGSSVIVYTSCWMKARLPALPAIPQSSFGTVKSTTATGEPTTTDAGRALAVDAVLKRPGGAATVKSASRRERIRSAAVVPLPAGGTRAATGGSRSRPKYTTSCVTVGAIVALGVALGVALSVAVGAGDRVGDAYGGPHPASAIANAASGTSHQRDPVMSRA